jgi:(4-O-methyl)-D-glucuronate---lignin esterase
MTLALFCLSLMQAQADVQPADSFPLIETMPDPFLFLDGRRVQTPEDWEERRAEMRKSILRYQYGHVPPAPDNVRMAEELESLERFGGRVIHKVMRLTMGPENKLSTTLHLLLPTDRPGPFPVIVRFGIDINMARAMCSRGYAYACFEQTDLDPDTEGHDVVGPAQQAYPDYDWASLAVWAWGASRVVDYLVTRPGIKADQIVITGHSRTGKAALLAGVLDERFALVVPNGSGCGGAAAYRNAKRGVETLKLITLESRFKSWLQKDFGRFGAKEVRLPFDQHFMRALVAPRPVLSTDGLGDTWANPPGTQLAWMAAQPVFDFLGVSENNLCHFRPGGHDQLPEDYEVLLDVADHVFRGKELATDFKAFPVPDMKPTWTWKAPQSGR